MTQIKYIRKLFHEEGKNVSQISKETGHDRKTVKYYLEKEDWNKEVPTASPVAQFPKLDPFKKHIDSWLLEDKKAKRKQRHTSQRVYDRLKDKYKENFNCSYRTVAGYVAQKKKEIFGKQAGYLPLEHIPGEAQVDFGDAEFYEKGKIYSGKYLNLSFPYSNKGYCQLFKGENQECLFEGLISIFTHIGGVPQRIWFDNASTMVTKVLKNGERNLTNDFMRFMEHYRFEAAFCNVDSGHEKGNVEGKVGYHRRNMLVPVPRFNCLAEFNKELLQKCENDAFREHYRKEGTIAQLHTEDREALLELPTVALDVSKYITVNTNGYGRFYLNNNLHEYSVSPKYANSKVLIRLTANEVIPMDESHRAVVRHERFYGNHKEQSMKWLPYLTQLSRFPGALKYTGIYQMLPESINNYLARCNKSDKGKVLQVIARLTEKSGFDSAVETVAGALQYEVTDTDSLLSLHNRIHGNVIELEPIRVTGSIPELTPSTPNLAAYDAGLKRQVINNAD
ncbi:IS21 family transposase [Desulfitibacter alkalitolerans]|uniref:IS21 family transposase n=1 Tax=Desulfitibacter alkalitolerans TaxID=264641 RepID=UPI000A0221D5